MKLCPPRIVGPVSTCNLDVVVEGQLTGATVAIIRNGNTANPIAKVAVGGARSAVHLTNLSAGGLKAGDLLTATQTVGPDTSDPSPEAVAVQSFDPAGLDKVIFGNHLYVCSRYMFLDGLVPGAEVLAGRRGSRGRATAILGYAFLTLDPALRDHEQIPVHQTASGQTGKDVLSLVPDQPPHVGHKLPTPAIAAPAYACDRYVLAQGIVDGADVTLFRNSKTESTTGSFFSAAWLATRSPLVEGDELATNQEMRQCELESDVSTPPRKVLPAKDVPAPVLAATGALCVGTTAVQVSNLAPGAKVRILQDGVEIGVGEAPDSSFPFSVALLTPGSVITAQQERCGIWGPLSNEVPVEKPTGTIQQARINVDPLFECAVAVPITGARPGSWIKVMSRKLGQISPAAYVTTPDAAIPVRPALQAGDEVFLVQTSCGMKPIRSKRVGVKPMPKLGIPKIVEPVEADQQQVRIQNLVPTATVQLFLNGVFQKSQLASAEEVMVNLGVTLKIGDKLNARQMLCAVVTPFDLEHAVVVVHPHPLVPEQLIPDGGTVFQGRRPTLSWRDPGSGQPKAADSFDLEITVNGTAFAPAPSATSPNYQFASDLPYSASLQWRVRARNSTGVSEWSQQASFSIQQAPPELKTINVWTAKSTDGPAVTSVPAGDGLVINARALDQYGNPMPGVQISFAVGNTSVGTLVWGTIQTTNSKGLAWELFDSKTSGTTTVSATSGSVSGSASVDVTQPPPTVKGYAELWFNNWSNDTLYVWRYDWTTGNAEDLGTILPLYQGKVRNFIANHYYSIWLVDPNLIGCGVNDPTNPNCYKWSSGPTPFLGDPNGYRPPTLGTVFDIY